MHQSRTSMTATKLSLASISVHTILAESLGQAMSELENAAQVSAAVAVVLSVQRAHVSGFTQLAQTRDAIRS
jgi:hypothetical protein